MSWRYPNTRYPNPKIPHAPNGMNFRASARNPKSRLWAIYRQMVNQGSVTRLEYYRGNGPCHALSQHVDRVNRGYGSQFWSLLVRTGWIEKTSFRRGGYPVYSWGPNARQWHAVMASGRLLGTDAKLIADYL